MAAIPHAPLSAAQRQDVSQWISANLESLPEPGQTYLRPHQTYLASGGNLQADFNKLVRELRRALGVTPASERRRSGNAKDGLPRRKKRSAAERKAKLLESLGESQRLGKWHEALRDRHDEHVAAVQVKLAELDDAPMPEPSLQTAPSETASSEPHAALHRLALQSKVEDIELSEEAEARAQACGDALAEHLSQGDDIDPALESTNEALMPSGLALHSEQLETLVVQLPEQIADAEVVKTLSDRRVRYDITLEVNRLELDVQKKVVVTEDGKRSVVSASTDAFGPPRYSVTWSALATLAVLFGQFAMPLNRLATMFGSVGKTFSTGAMCRMLHYVAERFVPIYLALSEQLADSDVLGADDTSCRVLEVSAFIKQADPKGGAGTQPPWAAFRTPAQAQKSIDACARRKQQRQARRAAGDRSAKPSPQEQPSLGMRIGRTLGFESALKDGSGPKQAMNTTVVSGRSVADDPASLIVFYRSHLGSVGNLLDAILKSRRSRFRDLMLQVDLSRTNLVSDPQLIERFNIKRIGCTAHARRPFAQNEDDDPIHCPHMLHLFTGLAMHESLLDEVGRNRDNVLAVRQNDSRRIWGHIKNLATTMTHKWTQATTLGKAARYIINHYDKLTAYLDDPRLEPTNNLRERMLRTEKLIESSSMFRKTLEGRFVLDVTRTILQTAVAADVPIHQYLTSVLRSDPDEVETHPDRFTPYAWALKHRDTDGERVT